MKDKENEKFVSKHSKVFKGVNAFPDKVLVKLNKNAVPKIFSARIPFAIRDKLMDKLNELIMESMKIIKEVNEPLE